MTLQDRIAEAGLLAAKHNKTYSVWIGEEPVKFDQPIIIPAHVSLGGLGQGARSGRLVYTGKPTLTPLITTGENSYGAVLHDFEIAIADTSMPNLVAIRPHWSSKNLTIRNFRFAHYGMNCIGVVVAGRESMTVEKVDIRCSVPLVIRGGDNHCFRDCDFGTSTTEAARATMHDGTLPCTCVWIDGMPHRWTFEGSQTWQGGVHAMFGDVTTRTPGSGLTVRNLRYEQSLSVLNPDVAAIQLRFGLARLRQCAIDMVTSEQRVNAVKLVNVENQKLEIVK